MTNAQVIDALIADVNAARARFLDEVRGLSHDQAQFKPDVDTWSVAENTEHITLAERSGTNYMWKALDGVARGVPVWSGEQTNAGLSADEVVARTWKPKENVPPIAAPHLGGPLDYWMAALRAMQPLLESLGKALESHDLAQVIVPHVLSGPLDARQRLEFLRLHLDRHREQVRRLKVHPSFPRN